MAALLLLPLFIAQVIAIDDGNCLAAAWLPEGSQQSFCAEPGFEYDGSLLPDCQAFEGQVNTTSFYHVHEFDCGLFWECGPEGLCLFACAECNVDPYSCPDGRLQFDCRHQADDLGPTCDWSYNVGCNDCEEACEIANCPAGQNCDVTTDCQCSDCREDSDCSAGEQCCNRNCAANCGSSPTPCPNECCADADCPAGQVCTDGSCLAPTTTQDPNASTTTTEDPNATTTEDPNLSTTTKCPTECCADSECKAGEECINGQCQGKTTTTIATTTTAAPTTTTAAPTTTTAAPTTTTPCPNECCADADCPPGFTCIDGSCEKPCQENIDCEGSDAVCNLPGYENCQYCNGEICVAGCAGDNNCAADNPQCNGGHACQKPGFPGLTMISVQTFDCSGCAGSSGQEGGLTVTLNDDSGLTCTSGGLDNNGTLDYDNGNKAEFNADEEDGMGGCEYANLNFNVASGTATWTGTGTWTSATHNPICLYFYSATADYYDFYNCCDLAENELSENVSTELTNCRMCVYGQDCP